MMMTLYLSVQGAWRGPAMARDPSLALAIRDRNDPHRAQPPSAPTPALAALLWS
jgi:hypothetical protein